MKEDKKKGANVPNLRFPGFEGEWKECLLGSISSISKGAGISKDQLSEEGKPCILYGELYTKYKSEVINNVLSRTDIDASNLVKSEANDVIIPSSGESAIDISTACCVPFSGILLGGDLNIIRLYTGDGRFLSYQLNGKRKYDIAKVAQGVSVVHLYGDGLKKLKVYYPATEEQHKIASLLSLIDERISAQSKIITQLESLMCGLRKKIFKQQIRFKDKGGNEFPMWKVKKLQNVCDIVGGGTPETIKNEYWEGNIQWFTPTEIKANFVSKSERTISQLGLKNSSAKILPKGTILLTTRATIGEVAIALEECTTNQGFQSLVVKKGINNTFLFHWIKENKYELMKRANGSTFPEVSKSEIERIQISIPSLMEQSFIADFFCSVNEKIETETKILKEYEVLKQYLLKNMFV